MIVGQDKGEEGNKPENTLTEKVEQEQNKPNMAEKMFHRADTWKARIDKFMNSKPVAHRMSISTKMPKWHMPTSPSPLPTS